MTAPAVPVTVLTRAAGAVVPTCEWSAPDAYPEFAPDPLTCPRPASVLRFIPGAAAGYFDVVYAACELHDDEPAATDRVAIADLPLVCSSCGGPVWLAHPAEHALGGCQLCPPAYAADHSTCTCPSLGASA